MKKLKLTKENISISLILILSLILNFFNINIEGYGSGDYAAGVKSMTMSLIHFFFVFFPGLIHSPCFRNISSCQFFPIGT